MRILSQREYFAYRFGMSDEEYGQHTAHIDKLLTDLKHQGVETHSMPEYSKGIRRRSDGKEITHWTPERRRQHQEIIRHFYDKMQGSGAGQEGKAIVMGGLGGAGKGHAQQSLPDVLDTHGYYTVNPDDIKEEMARRGMIPKADHLSPMETSGLAHEEASDLAKRVATLGYRQKRNLIWDITMSSPGSVAGRVNAMRKMGYGQIDGVFVDADPAQARQRVKDRHRQDEEPYRDSGFAGQIGGPGPDGKEMMGGRWVPEELTKGNLPTPGSGRLSKNGEVFDQMRPMFDNTLDIDSSASVPKVRNQTGIRWKSGFPTWQPGQGAGVLGRRFMAWLRQADEGDGGVRALIEEYATGQMTFIELVDVLASYDYSDPSIDESSTDWADTIDRGETEHDDDSFFWVEAAADDGTLVPRQVDLIVEAIERYHDEQGDSDYVVDDDYDDDYGDEDDDDEDEDDGDVDQFTPDADQEGM